MALRSIQSLQKMMEESRLRHQQQREKKKQDRIKQYRELCKEADRLLKEALEEEKKKTMDYLSTLAPKTPQRALKQEITVSRTPIYNNKYIERGFKDIDLYQTREELEAAEPGNINWKVWNRIVQQTRQQINQL